MSFRKHTKGRGKGKTYRLSAKENVKENEEFLREMHRQGYGTLRETFKNGWKWIGQTPNSGEYEVDVDKLLKLFGLEHRSPDEASEHAFENMDFDFSDYERQLEEEGLSPEQIQEKVQEAQDKEVDEQVREYQNNLESAIEQYLTSHPIRGIRSVNIDWGKGKAKIEVDDLNALLTSERQVMNGVGMFEAGSNEELITVSSSNSVAEAASSHFGWLSEAAEVYGTSSIERILDRRY